MNKGKFYFSVKDFLEDNSNNTKNVFLLIAEYTNFQITDLNNYQGKSSGAIVPFVIYNNEFFNKGVIACFLEEASSIALIKDLSVFDIDNSFFKNKESFIVLLDGLSSNITNFLDNLFENIPQNTQVMGGGAGKLTLKNDPVIFLEGKLYSNAAIIIATSFKLHTKVANGWEHLEGPFLTTNSYQNVLKTLNFKKAFDVYKDVVEQNSGMKFTDDNFFDIAKFYPLGIVKFNSEAVVRDPIYLNEDNDMVLVGDIPQNSTINILKGEKENLLNSSKTALEEVLKESNSQKNQDIFIFDCIARSIFLGDDFTEELNVIKSQMEENSTLFGALTFGEISSSQDKYINFYNKSCVLGVLC